MCETGLGGKWVHKRFLWSYTCVLRRWADSLRCKPAGYHPLRPCGGTVTCATWRDKGKLPRNLTPFKCSDACGPALDLSAKLYVSFHSILEGWTYTSLWKETKILYNSMVYVPTPSSWIALIWQQWLCWINNHTHTLRSPKDITRKWAISYPYHCSSVGSGNQVEVNCKSSPHARLWVILLVGKLLDKSEATCPSDGCEIAHSAIHKPGKSASIVSSWVSPAVSDNCHVFLDRAAEMDFAQWGISRWISCIAIVDVLLPQSCSQEHEWGTFTTFRISCGRVEACAQHKWG